MNTLKQKLHNWHWYHWVLVVLLTLYGLFVALSYLYLPGKLKDVVQTDVAHRIGRDIQVERIAFNPFRLALTVDKFAVADRPTQPLLAWDKFYLNFDAWGSLFGGQIRLTSLMLDAPNIGIERRKDDFNFSSIFGLLATPETEQPATAPEQKTALAIQVDDIQIHNGQFHFDDVSGIKPARSSLHDISLGVQNLYLATGDEKLNPFSLQANMPDGGTVKLSGEYRADPLLVNSKISASAINLVTFADFIENQIPLKLSKGVLSLQADVKLKQQQDEVALQIQKGSITVKALALDDEKVDPPLLRGKQITVSGIEMDLLQQQLHIASAVLDGFSVNQWLDAQGHQRYESLLARQVVSANTAPVPVAETKPWDFAIAHYEVKNSQLSFADQSDGINAIQRLDALSVTLENLRIVDNAQVPITFSATLNDSGTLSMSGIVVPLPFALDLNYQLDGIAVAPFNPYVSASTWLQLQQGVLNAKGTLAMATTDAMPLTLALDAQLQDFSARDSRTGKSVLKWKALQLQQLQLDLAQHSVNLEQLVLSEPEIDVAIDADKQLNLATLVKPADTAAAAPDATSADASATSTIPAAATPWQIAVHQVLVQQGITRFRDASITPAFKTGLFNLDFKLDNLTSEGTTPATFSLNSKVDRYAPFTAKGTLVPLAQQPGFAFTSQLQGLEMPALSPYTGTFIGYQLDSGKLGLQLDYAVKNRKLKGKNNVVAKQLYLGEEVASEQAVNAPVALGLALLRDAHGVIDLDVGVSGNLDDPGFSVSGIVLKALMNIIVKAATSPFQLLGSLVGDQEDLGAIEFAAGESALSADAQEKLQQLVKALQQRPQLAVTIRGTAGDADDSAGLQLKRVLEQIATARKVPVTDLQVDSLLTDKANRNALEELNDELKLADEDDRESALEIADSALQGDALTEKVYQQMLQDVAGAQVIAKADLLALADQRALAIKQYLVETAQLDHSRIQMAKAKKTDLKGRVCELGLAPG